MLTFYAFQTILLLKVGLTMATDGTVQEASIVKLDNLIGNMEEQHLTSDSRYASALQLKAKLTGMLF